MLTKDEIETNKNKILELVGKIENDKVNTGELAEHLLATDFFEAPASTKFNCAYEGGLCEHTLNVYRNLSCLVKNVLTPSKITMKEDNTAESVTYRYSDELIFLTALLHDISKIGYYEKYSKSVKKYIEEKDVYNQSKWDPSVGKWYNWTTEEAYKVKDADDKDNIGSKGLSILLTLNRFIPVSDPEFKEMIVALANQYDGSKEMDPELKLTLKSYPLTALLHSADLIACYITDYEQDN